MASVAQAPGFLGVYRQDPVDFHTVEVAQREIEAAHAAPHTGLNLCNVQCMPLQHTAGVQGDQFRAWASVAGAGSCICTESVTPGRGQYTTSMAINTGSAGTINVLCTAHE